MCCSIAQSCPTLCDPKDCSTLGLPVPHHLPKFASSCSLHQRCHLAISSSDALFSFCPQSFPGVLLSTTVLYGIIHNTYIYMYICIHTTPLFIPLLMDTDIDSTSWLLEWCYEHWGLCTFLNYSFPQIYAQEWDCWIIGQLLFSVF